MNLHFGQRFETRNFKWFSIIFDRNYTPSKYPGRIWHTTVIDMHYIDINWTSAQQMFFFLPLNINDLCVGLKTNKCFMLMLVPTYFTWEQYEIFHKNLWNHFLTNMSIFSIVADIVLFCSKRIFWLSYYFFIYQSYVFNNMNKTYV